MDLTQEELIDRLCLFTQTTLGWCAKESEEGTTRVTKAIDLLLKHTARVSQISKESMAAIEGMQKAIHIHLQGDHSRESLALLIKSLLELANEHNEIQTVIHPIIQSLQFQDRLRQNLENMVKMLGIWLDFRHKIATHARPEELLQLGEELIKATTMIAERDIIRAHIAGLSPEVQVPAVNLF